MHHSIDAHLHSRERGIKGRAYRSYFTQGYIRAKTKTKYTTKQIIPQVQTASITDSITAPCPCPTPPARPYVADAIEETAEPAELGVPALVVVGPPLGVVVVEDPPVVAASLTGPDTCGTTQQMKKRKRAMNTVRKM